MKRNVLLILIFAATSLLANLVWAGVTYSGDTTNSFGFNNGSPFNNLIIGNTNGGAMLTVDGGSVLATNQGGRFTLFAGYSSTSSGNTITVTGAGSLISTGAIIGRESSGNQLNINSGGGMTGGLVVGERAFGFPTTNNSVLITDAGSYVNTGLGMIAVGSSNSLTLQNGAHIASVGLAMGSGTVVNITDGGSMWDFMGGAISVNSGSTLNVSNGAHCIGLDGGLELNGPETVVFSGAGTSISGGGGSLFIQGEMNQTTISGGAQASFGSVSISSGGLSGSSLSVTGPGSRLTLAPASGFSLSLNSGVTVTVSNDAQLRLNGDAVTSGGTIIITGGGSQLICLTNTIYIGSYPPSSALGSGDQLMVATGSSVMTPDLYIGRAANASVPPPLAAIAGSLVVRNGTGTGTLGVYGVLTNMGTISADQIIFYPGSSFSGSGSFAARNITVSNGAPFIVGDGTDAANVEMEGGTYSFENGIVISANATLFGCGTIRGSVTNYGTIILTEGCDLDFSGPVVNNGQILALNGTPHFNSTFVNNGKLFQNETRVAEISIRGTNVIVQFNTTLNYLQDLQVSSNLASGIWTGLTNGVLGTGGPMSFTDFGGATNAFRFYRVLVHY